MNDLALFEPRLQRRRIIGQLFGLSCAAITLVAIMVLAVLLVRVFEQGWSRVSFRFLEGIPSQLTPEKSGIKAALWGSVWLITLTAAFAVPVGIGAAIYLQEYARQNRFTRFIQITIANLAGVPSIVYGILGLAVFVRAMHLDRSLISGALTMALLVLPVIIIAAREALAAVPDSIRQAAYALGATRWVVIRHHVLPAAIPGISTGVILALSRAVGEAAPLLLIGAAAYVAFVPTGPGDTITAMPVQIYNWTKQPKEVFHELAAAGIVVLLALLLTMNALAIIIRSRHQGRLP